MIDRLMLEQAYLEEHERRLRIMNARQAYEGNLKKPLKVEKNQPDDNIRLNLGGLVVDAGVSFLFPEGLSFEVDGAAKSEADTWLADCWEQNRLAITLEQLGLNGGICGDAFLRVVPRKGFPRVIVQDPGDVTVITDEDDYQEVLAYVIQWNTVSHATRKPVCRRKVIERDNAESTVWTITEYESASGNKWTPRKEPQVWPYAWPPIFHCQNLPCANSYYGYSDLEFPLIDLNHALNLNVSNTARIIRFHAHPKTVAKGLAGATVDVAANGIIQLPGKDSDLFNLEMQSDLASSLSFIELLRSFYHQTSEIPEVAAGKVEDLGQLSGLALQILYGPLLKKTGKKRPLYDELLCSVNRALLELGGQGEHKVKTFYPSVLPSDAKGDREVAVMDEALGVSRNTILSKFGYNPEDEAAKKAKERKSDRELGGRLLKDFERDANPEDDEDAEGEE